MGPRFKLFLMFFLLWVVFLGIGYGILYGLMAVGVFTESSYMYGFMAVIIAAITAPIAAMLVQLAISRSREYKADRVGARTIRDPLALANALRKLDKGVKLFPMKMAKASPAHSSLFIVNPFRGGGFVAMFSTHPPLKERIRRLEEMHATGTYFDD